MVIRVLPCQSVAQLRFPGLCNPRQQAGFQDSPVASLQQTEYIRYPENEVHALKDKRLTPARIALLYAVFAGLWIFASDRLLALAVADPQWLVQMGTFKGIAFVTVTASLLYLLLKTRDAHTVSADTPGSVEVGAPKLRYLIAIFLCLGLIVPLFGIGIAKVYGPRVQQTAYNDLSSIAELKAGQIENWLQERLADANELTERYTIIEMAERWVRRGDIKARDYVLSRMATLARAHGYDSVLLDVNGKRVLALTATPDDPIDAATWRALLPPAAQRTIPRQQRQYLPGLSRAAAPDQSATDGGFYGAARTGRAVPVSADPVLAHRQPQRRNRADTP